MIQKPAPQSLYKSDLGSGRSYRRTRSPEAEPFWLGCQQRRLLLPQCKACNRCHFYPRRFCPHCASRDIEWRPASGRGTLYSFAVVHQPLDKAFASRVPYCIAIVELEESVRMQTQLVGFDEGAIYCDLPVEVDFMQIFEDLTIPVFRRVDQLKSELTA